MTEEKNFYLTKAGLEKIKKEYNTLKGIRLAKSKGDSPAVLHSEELNPEYLVFQEDIAFIDSKLNEIEKVIKSVQLISLPPKSKRDFIGLGATVFVEVDGQNDQFTIVGSLEANPSLGKISNESPVGQALIGKKIKDEVVISSPVKTIYKIKKIKYHLS